MPTTRSEARPCASPRAARRRGFWRRRDGAIAVEFALIAGPLIFLIFCVVDLAFVLLISSTLDAAMSGGARLVRTGQMQQSSTNTVTNLKSKVCAQMAWMQSDCLQHLNLDVRTYSSFTAAATPPNPVSNGKFDPSVLAYSPGAQGDVVVVRGYYQWPLFTPFLSQALSALGNGSVVITSTVAFKNEPW
jgi:Flp pilus assembly protein TadG